MSDIVAGGASGAGSAQPCPLPDDLRAAVDDIAAGLGKAAGVEPWRLSDAEWVSAFVELLDARARLETVTARILGAIDSGEVAKTTTGASSTHAWLHGVLGLSHPDASRLLVEARVFAHGKTHEARAEHATRIEPSTNAWLDGRLNAEQTVLISRAVTKVRRCVPLEAVHGVQDDLIDDAATLSYEELGRVANHAVEVIDPDGADQRLADQLEAEEARALAETTLAFGPAVAGVVTFKGKLPALQADIWRTHLDAFTAPRHQTSTATSFWTTQGTGHGSGQGSGQTAEDRIVDDIESQGRTLSYGQRLGRAHCDLLEHLPTDGLPQHGATNTTIVVTIDHTDLANRVGQATLETGTTGTAVSAGQTRRLACNARLLPAVLDGPSRVLDLGTAQRLFDRTQRLALHLRDKGCIFPGCDRPPGWCEAHHIHPWSHGGLTNLHNGCLLCPFHHHLIHTGNPNTGWWIHIHPDGTPEVLPRHRVDPTRTPRRHTRFLERPPHPPARGPSPPG